MSARQLLMAACSVLLACAYSLTCVTLGAAETGPALVPLDVGAFYDAPDETAVLRWSLPHAVGVDDAAYEINDYTGKSVAKDRATTEAGETLQIRVRLPRGWYEIRFPKLGVSFGYVVIEPHSGPCDEFFCLDGALSWVETRTEVRPALVKALKRAGVALVRERLSWGRINPGRDIWDWDAAPRRHDSLRRLYRQEGVPLLEILGGSAPRASHLDEIPQSPFPRDYPEVFRSWKQIIDRYRDIWGAEETWNEPELTQIPADQFAGLVKVGAYTLRHAGLTMPTGGGALATIPPGPFFDALVANGFLDQVDYVSFHTYDPPRAAEPMLTRYRAWLKTAGKEMLPLWVTESGAPWTSGPSRPPRREDEHSALDIVMKAVEFRAGGAARYFPFVYGSYREGAKNFGMLGAEATPLRAMGAYVNAIRTLSGYHYVGDLTPPIPNSVAARVFESDLGSDLSLLVVYRGAVGEGATFSLPLDPVRAAGIDGREFPISRVLPIPDGLTYVWLNRAALRPYLRTDAGMMALRKASRVPEPSRSEPTPIVLQYLFDRTPTQLSQRCYWVDEATARDLSLTVRASNLGTEDCNLLLRANLPGDAGSAVQSTQPLRVPAGKFTETRFHFDASEALDLAEPRFIEITATTDRGARADTLALPFARRGSLEQHLVRHPKKHRMPIEDLARWKPNIVPGGRMSLSLEGGCFRAEAQLASAGGWFFPRFVVPENTFSERTAGILVRARLLQPGRHVAVYAEIDDHERFWIDQIFPADGSWQVAYIPLDELTPAPGHPDLQNARLDRSRLRRLSFGCVSNGPTNTLEVSDLWIIERP